MHLVDHAHGRVEDRVGADGAAALAQAQAEAQQGADAEVGEEALVPRLVAAVAEDAVFEHLRVKPRGQQDAVGHDEAVDEDDHLQLGGPQHAGHGHHHLVAPEVAGDGEGPAVALVAAEGLFQDLVLVAHALGVEPAAGAHAVDEGDARQAGHP